ncbi:putative ubiquitin carboxyl-terminal hydrolase MINDY-4 isoform X3 [Phascolarctos cinereus]|uniref:Ubiquitin carboxyl-terminal hydrolase MINDY n=1 Tax=Phascolarctos cinereus TaxID=38626 RepID=A0A6P5ID58_PHACI|nr:probable ubiquitin carboxyl-terminal hydrolase MINDY-4 isoform X3 [Phascolarctos cinereus]
MEHLFVEEVAASLVREFLNRKGLKKTSLVMDQEHPRGERSINNRNELRKVLHLEMLYKENKAKKSPLKTSLEIITSYFLDHFGKNSDNLIQEAPLSIVSASKMNDKLPLKCSENSAVNNNNACEISSDRGKNSRHGECDGDTLGNTASPKRPLHKSKTLKSIAGDGNYSPPAGREKIMASSMENPKMVEPSSEVKKMGDVRFKPGLLARGILSGPITQEDPLRKRFLRRLSGPNAAQSRDEDPPKSLELSPTGHVLSDASVAKNASSSRKSLGIHGNWDSEKWKNPPSASDPLSKMRLETAKNRLKDFPEGKATVSNTGEKTGPDGRLLFPCGSSKPSQERQEKAFKWNTQALANRTLSIHTMPVCVSEEADVLTVEDMEDEELLNEDIVHPSALSTSLLKLQVTSKPMSLVAAKEIKTVLFGSALCGFNEEWKLQNFTFSEMAQLKYGLVQNKGGPCGVLAAVQGCVLKNLLFGGESRRTSTRELQPSDTYRTNCLIMAMADILWRAGGEEKAVVAFSHLNPALPDIITVPGVFGDSRRTASPSHHHQRMTISGIRASGMQQFSPGGKYKADGVLEMLILHKVTKYEDLVIFLQQNIHQFQTGPSGCILLTLSAILSRSTDLVRRDFDVPTNCLIGAHGYCTQELVNLLLTGKAVSNVFNDVVELDSGNGNITLLRGITSRSDVGLLSLFEHYDVCQVGCYLKTPRYPIWVVCSESHFSVLFSLQRDLLSDWKVERIFDLYYYDGLANQQGEIRLTIDTTQPVPRDREKDLVPPLEHCIRTKQPEDTPSEGKRHCNPWRQISDQQRCPRPA